MLSNYWYVFYISFSISSFLKYAAKEAEIIAQAGRKHAITISTNMAGRGTDIILGGNAKVYSLSEHVQVHACYLTSLPPLNIMKCCRSLQMFGFHCSTFQVRVFHSVQ